MKKERTPWAEGRGIFYATMVMLTFLAGLALLLGGVYLYNRNKDFYSALQGELNRGFYLTALLVLLGSSVVYTPFSFGRRGGALRNPFLSVSLSADVGKGCGGGSGEKGADLFGTAGDPAVRGIGGGVALFLLFGGDGGEYLCRGRGPLCFCGGIYAPKSCPDHPFGAALVRGVADAVFQLFALYSV